MKTTTEQTEAIVTLLNENYFPGLFNGDVARLSSIFHPNTILMGEVKGNRYAKTLSEYLTTVATRISPKDANAPFIPEIISTDVVGPIAAAKVRVRMYEYNYIDFLSLCLTDGRWQIVSKILTHVDGGHEGNING